MLKKKLQEHFDIPLVGDLQDNHNKNGFTLLGASWHHRTYESEGTNLLLPAPFLFASPVFKVASFFSLAVDEHKKKKWNFSSMERHATRA
jgi:hypothetical protein